MRGIPLIVLALTLAACAQGPRGVTQNGAAENLQYRREPNFPGQPTAIICAVPAQEPVRAEGPAGNKQEPRRILVPDGQKPTDFCPETAITGRLHHFPSVSVPFPPGVIYSNPEISGMPGPPPVPTDNLSPAKPEGQTP